MNKCLACGNTLAEDDAAYCDLACFEIADSKSMAAHQEKDPQGRWRGVVWYGPVCENRKGTTRPDNCNFSVCGFEAMLCEVTGKKWRYENGPQPGDRPKVCEEAASAPAR